MNTYNPLDPYSFGDTKKLEANLRREKTQFKKEELEKELKDDNR